MIGIDKYIFAPPLSYACNDATAFASTLRSNFDFPVDHLTLLLDGEATLEQIRAKLAYLCRETGENDRVIIFFAGHGHTELGNRREVGFLVPLNGDSDDISTLLPWDELAKFGELIRAKHVLFIMDACYSGLISMRKLARGGSRLAHDMLTRYSRQYLTAGKANQTVADAGGPRQGHSIFTGHLLDALEATAGPNQLITANTVMAYVYDRVSRDPSSEQTPHYGWLEGDGDLFFTLPHLDLDPKTAGGVLITIPAELTVPEQPKDAPSIIERIKEYLSEHKYRIQLYDTVVKQLGEAQQRISEQQFPLQPEDVSNESFTARVTNYEDAVLNVLRTSALVGRWANNDQLPIISEIVTRLAGHIESKGGLVLYLNMRWFPMHLAMYAGGIGALHGHNYAALREFFATRVPNPRDGRAIGVLEATVDAIGYCEQAFKRLPGHERNYAPRSEYLYTRIQPIVEDILVIGARYESTFDRFELLQALSYADATDRSWGPPGRFAWKYRQRFGGITPFDELIEEATDRGDRWPPLTAGMFKGSLSRFLEVASRVKTEMLDRLGWH